MKIKAAITKKLKEQYPDLIQALEGPEILRTVADRVLGPYFKIKMKEFLTREKRVQAKKDGYNIHGPADTYFQECDPSASSDMNLVNAVMSQVSDIPGRDFDGALAELFAIYKETIMNCGYDLGEFQLMVTVQVDRKTNETLLEKAETFLVKKDLKAFLLSDGYISAEELYTFNVKQLYSKFHMKNVTAVNGNSGIIHDDLEMIIKSTLPFGFQVLGTNDFLAIKADTNTPLSDNERTWHYKIN